MFSRFRAFSWSSEEDEQEPQKRTAYELLLIISLFSTYMPLVDCNRVLLRPLRDATYPSFWGADEADYINASYIDVFTYKQREITTLRLFYLKGYDKKKKFIVTQYPMEMTKIEFWRMVVQEDVATIINLTETKEEKPVIVSPRYNQLLALFSV